MVRLTMTPAIVEALQFCHDNCISGWPLDLIDEEPMHEPQLGNPISHGQIIELSRCLDQHENSDGSSTTKNASPTPKFQLEVLLRGSHVYVEPPKPKPEPSSEYKALMARLREEEEARSYQRMVQPQATAGIGQIASGAPGDEDDEITYADINRQVGLIINVLLSVVACSVALWMAARHWSAPSRLGLSMSGGGLVGIAEVVIYSGYLRRLTEAKSKEKKMAEKKEVVETWVIGPKETEQGSEKIIEPRTSFTDLRRRAIASKT